MKTVSGFSALTFFLAQKKLTSLVSFKKHSKAYKISTISYDFIKVAKIQPHFIRLDVTSVYLKNSDSEAFENIIRSPEEEYPCLSATFQCGVQSEDRFISPIFFPTTITSCSSGQKAGLTQSSSA